MCAQFCTNASNDPRDKMLHGLAIITMSLVPESKDLFIKTASLRLLSVVKHLTDLFILQVYANHMHGDRNIKIE